MGVDDRELYHALKPGELGVVVTAHCENETLIAEKQAELSRRGVPGPEGTSPRPRGSRRWGSSTRGVCAGDRAEGTSFTPCRDARQRPCGLARGVTDARRDGGRRTRDARLDVRRAAARRAAADRGRGSFPASEGVVRVMSPPIRDRQHQERCGKALADGTIDCVGTDTRRSTSRARRRWKRRLHEDPQRHPERRAPRGSDAHLRRARAGSICTGSSMVQHASRGSSARGGGRSVRRRRRGHRGVRPGAPLDDQRPTHHMHGPCARGRVGKSGDAWTVLLRARSSCGRRAFDQREGEARALDAAAAAAVAGTGAVRRGHDLAMVW